MNASTNLSAIENELKAIFVACEPVSYAALCNELNKLVPSENCEIFLATDFQEERRTIGLGLYVNTPKLSTHFAPAYEVIAAYLSRATEKQTTNLAFCLNLLRACEGSKYEVDFIPIAYTPSIDKYGFHFRIFKI